MGLKQELLYSGDPEEMMRLIKHTREELKTLIKAAERIDEGVQRVTIALTDIRKLTKTMMVDYNQRSLF